MVKHRDCTIHMVGHGHIDPTWLWRWTEGYEEVRATFRSALDRMNETPAFKFSASSACFYAWVKACDPEMFEEIKARVKEGRWELAGGWWVEPDANIPGGESFVRHGLYSQRFFKKEFGVYATVGFNPDTFGHAGTLPQIYKKSGIDYYVYMRPSASHEMDYPDGTTFWWRSADGSEILACNLQDGYSTHDEVIPRIARLAVDPHLNPGQKHILGFYGVGNHGGGPTKRAIAGILEAKKDAHLPKVQFSTLAEYFEGFLASTPPASIPRITTDLQHHARGCYSVHSEIKRLNRECEHALMSAERFATAAWLLEGHPYPQEALQRCWEDLLYNQFHDILAGTSIEVSYQDSRDQLGAARHRGDVIKNESIQHIARSVNTTGEGNTVIAVNPLPWPVVQTVTAPQIVARELEGPIHFVDEDEELVASQAVRAERIGHTAYKFTAELPAMGYRGFHARSGGRHVKSRGRLEAGRDFIENDWWRLELDPYDGHICRLYDRRNRVDVLRKGNVLACMVDHSDTWSHDVDEYRVEAGRFGNARLTLDTLGDVCATIRITSTFDRSTVEQFITLYREVETIDCEFRINWQQRYTTLKLGYETNVAEGTAAYDTAYGVQIRDRKGFEEPGQMWFALWGEVDERQYGFGVLNDSKYGFDIADRDMRVTMLRSPAYAHHDRGRYDASEPYAIMDQGWQTVRIRLMPFAGSPHEARLSKRAWELNEPAFVHVESAHKGKRKLHASLIGTEAENVLLTVLKKREDSKDLIVRGYETDGVEVTTRLHLPFRKKTFTVTFAPYEIKTLRINPKKWTVREVNLLEE